MPQATLERSRSELSDFLRSRRARLSPDEVGLPAGGRRRTKGLRREEVASLAGVGLTWYTWFEQGRNIRVSPDFLENVARALRLDGAERQHLFALLAHDAAPPRPSVRHVSLALQRVLDGFPHYPAYIRTMRWDTIAWNKPADRIFNFSRRAPEQRNLVRMVFTDPEMRAMMPNWESDAPKLIAKFRGYYAKQRGDATLEALVRELQDRSAEFRLWWRRHDVLPSAEGIKVLRLKGKGDVVMEHTSFTVNGEPDLTLLIHAPLDESRSNGLRI
jgi:transcriptional regulator with XRE-family HTH domain